MMESSWPKRNDVWMAENLVAELLRTNIELRELGIYLKNTRPSESSIQLEFDTTRGPITVAVEGPDWWDLPPHFVEHEALRKVLVEWKSRVSRN